MALPIRRITPQPKPLRARPQVFASPFNSGSLVPIVTAVARRPPPHHQRGTSIAIAAPFNSGGATPLQLLIERRPPPTRTRRSLYFLPAPAFNSGGQAPIVTAVARRPPPKRPKAFLSEPLFIITAGVMPVISQGVKRPPPTRDHRSQYVLPAATFNSGGSSSTVTAGVRRINRSRPLSRMVVPPPLGAPPPALNPAASAGVPLDLFV